MFIFDRLIDLGDENITELKPSNEVPDQVDDKPQNQEAAVDVIEKMAENSKVENPVRILF